jgi:hypothetical protein
MVSIQSMKLLQQLRCIMRTITLFQHIKFPTPCSLQISDLVVFMDETELKTKPKYNYRTSNYQLIRINAK